MDEAAVRGAYGDGAFEGLARYAEILRGRGIEWGLIGPGEVGRLWERHILNSLAVLGWVGQGATVVDVGSGAGLPGVPVALVRPDVRVTLLEPNLRRSGFLSGVVEELGLAGQVQVVRARAEEHEGTYDVVLSRAVAPLAKLVGWCSPLMAPGGSLVALKGRSAVKELAAAGDALKAGRLKAQAHEVSVPGADEPTWVVVMTRRSRKFS